MATNKNLTSKVHQIASGEITAYYTSAAKSKGIENALPRSLTLINGFNLHAKVGVAAFARDRLLQLIKYVTRPPISNERLSRREAGDLLY